MGTNDNNRQKAQARETSAYPKLCALHVGKGHLQDEERASAPIFMIRTEKQWMHRARLGRARRAERPSAVRWGRA